MNHFGHSSVYRDRMKRNARTLPAILCRFGLAGLLSLGACAEPERNNYFSDQEASLRAAGRFKTDRAPVDAPITADRLVRNFNLVAFGSEFDIENGRYVARARQNGDVLRRWTSPLRYRLMGRITVRDQHDVAEFAARLTEATGLKILPAEDDTAANLEIRILGPDERSRLGSRLQDGPLAELFGIWAKTAEWPCAGEFYYQRPPHAEANQITYATIYIRDEVKGLYRKSCIEEEMSQVLGLGRDDASVRPSIFNDDEEFALLTRHDSLLLQILYDRRLRPGMSPAEAMPLVRQIAGELARPAPTVTAKGPGT